ncbi:MAG: glycosyltransferase family 4 protein [Actinomycetota bacterium]
MDLLRRSPRNRFLFLTSNAGWGGSEELWSSVAQFLANEGHEVMAQVGWHDKGDPRLQRLRDLGCKIQTGWIAESLPGFRHPLMDRVLNRLNRMIHALRFRFFIHFNSDQDLVIISQGGNCDGLLLAEICLSKGMPYVLIAHKAAEVYWPSDAVLPRLRKIYADALHCFFVSSHNLRLTEEQLGMGLTRASVVRNPFLVPWNWDGGWPESSGVFNLACVGRLQPSEKGQDILLRVLARPKWRQRPLRVTFFGSGGFRNGLEGMAKLLKLDSVTFGGFVRDVASIWKTHHALVLPSRCEGLPLVVVEAMLHGRLPILTNVAGNGEVVEEGRTGFLAAAPTEDALDAAMENAWIRRHEWQEIGAAASVAIRQIVPPNPPATMAAMLLELVHGPRPDGVEENRPAPLATAIPALPQTEDA